MDNVDRSSLPPDRLWQPTTAKWFAVVFGATVAYSILRYHLHTQLTSGGLLAMWHRLAWILEPWYDEIGRQARASAVSHADETGWRVEGQTCWLWCFANAQTSYYSNPAGFA